MLQRGTLPRLFVIKRLRSSAVDLALQGVSMNLGPPSVKVIIFDLDGTLLDTESLVSEVAKGVLRQHGAQLTTEAQKAGIGKRPLEAWQAVIDLLSLDATAQQLVDQSEPLLQARWQDCRLLPGAARLLRHLHCHGVPTAVATSTPRQTYDCKMQHHQEFKAHFKAVKCGDEVVNGKPAPDCFIAAAERMGVTPAECLVIEDAPSGVEAATAAGMRVVVVPSLAKDAYPEPRPDARFGCCAVLPSLLDFQPQHFGLPAFNDLIHGTVPLDPVWRIKGTVVKGFGRGSKELGIPTANLDAESLRGALAEAVTGIYCGWASVGAQADVYKMVMSIGYNPFYKNEEKTVEPWLLHKFPEDFYSEELRLVVCAYLRPEANFESLNALIQRIHKDAEVTALALEDPRLAVFSDDSFLKPLTPAIS